MAVLEHNLEVIIPVCTVTLQLFCHRKFVLVFFRISTHFHITYPTPAESCFILIKRGFIKAIHCGIATTFLQLGDLKRSVYGERCKSFGFDSRRGFAWEM